MKKHFFDRINSFPVRKKRTSAFQTHRERTRLLLKNGFSFCLANLVTAPLTVVLLWSRFDPTLLLFWLGGISLSSLVNLAVIQRQKAVDPDLNDQEKWVTRYFVSSLTMAFIWGVGGWFFFDPSSIIHQTLLILILMGGCPPAMASMSSFKRVFFGYVLLLSSPLIMRLFLAGTKEHDILGILGLIFVGSILALGNNIHDTLLNSLKLHIENLRLVKKLSLEKEQSERFNLELKDEIDQRQKIEDELQEAKEVVEESLRSKNNFLANMSHEFRTPMNSIVGMTKLTLALPLADAQRKNLKEVLIASETLLSWMDRIIELSLMEFGEIHLDQYEFDFRQLIVDTMDLFAEKSQKKDLELFCVFNAAPESWYIGDPVRVRKVFENLLENSIKFTEKGTITLTLEEKRIEGEHCFFTISIHDTGIGIEPVLQEKIFNCFTQGDDSKTRKYGGIGAGITIARQIVRLMDGDIWLDSTPGEGTTVHFTIKLKRSASTIKQKFKLPGGGTLVHGKNSQQRLKDGFEAVQALNAPEVAQTARNHDNNGTLALRVLLVEDNQINRILVSTLLQKSGIEVDIAINGLEALRVYEKEKYDLIIMDLQMPEMSGYEATRKIREKEKETGEHQWIIAMTASNMPGDREKCLDVGMDEYISKPIDAEKLFSVINMIFTTSFAQSKAPEVLDFTKKEAPPLLPYVDMEEGIKRWGGKKENYFKILNKFAEERNDNLQDIREAYEEKNYDSLIQLSHALKGVSGNISAKALEKIITELEHTARRGEFEKLNPLLEEVESCIEKTITTIWDLIHQFELSSGKPIGNEDEKTVDREELEKLIRKTMLALEQGEAVEAEFCICEIIPLLQTLGISSSQLEDVQEALDNFELEKARKFFIAIVEKLGFVLEEREQNGG